MEGSSVNENQRMQKWKNNNIQKWNWNWKSGRNWNGRVSCNLASSFDVVLEEKLKGVQVEIGTKLIFELVILS